MALLLLLLPFPTGLFTGDGDLEELASESDLLLLLSSLLDIIVNVDGDEEVDAPFDCSALARARARIARSSDVLAVLYLRGLK